MRASKEQNGGVVPFDRARSRRSDLPPFAEWAREAQQGSKDAEARIASALWPGTYMVLVKRGAGDFAQDLAQETIFLTLEKVRNREIDDPQGLAKFVRTTAINLWSNHRRKSERQRRLSTEGYIPGVATFTSGYEEVSQEAVRDAVRKALDEVEPPQYRDVLWRWYVLREPKARICADYKISSSQFNQRTHHARAKLRTILEKRFGERAEML